MKNKVEEQVIYPKDLLFAALRRWRGMLALGLVLAVLLGGLQLSQGLGSNAVDPEAQEAYTEALAAYEKDVAAAQKVVDRCKAEVAEQERYMEQSELLNLNPYQHYRGTLSVYISTDYQIQPDKTYQTPNALAYLLSAYRVTVSSDAAIAEMAKAVNMEWQMLREILSVEVDGSAATLVVCLRHSDQAEAQKLLGIVSKRLEEAYGEFGRSIGTHELVVLENSVSLVTDTGIASAIRDNQNHLNSLRENLANAENALRGIAAPVQPQAGGVSLKKVVIFAVLGFVAGAAIMAVCAWFGHMESDKVYSARLLELRTGVKLLGTLPTKAYTGIDGLLRKWEGRDMAAPEKKAALLACDLRNRFGAGETVLLTGTGKAEDRAVLAQALADVGMKTLDAGNVLESAEAVEALGAAQAVVLVACCFRSTCTDVYRQMQMVSDYGKQLLGCVVLDG